MRSIQNFFLTGKFAVLLCLLVTACSYNKKEDHNSGDLKVQIPVYAQGEYRLSVMSLSSIVDLTHLKGAAAQFFVGPKILNGHLTGHRPEIHYLRTRGDVIVPTDVESLEFLTIYGQFEQLRLLDKSLGVESVNHWPVTVAVNVLSRNGNTGEIEQNNAFYTGEYDAYLFAPYTRAQLPLMVNSGVLAHEHFHSLYQHIVVDPIKDKYPDASKATAHNEKARLAEFGLASAIADVEPNSDSAKGKRQTRGAAEPAATDADAKAALHTKYHTLFLRGVNEGLADVWGWIYSGDDSFVGRSLPSEIYSRNLSIPIYQVEPKEMLKQDVSHLKLWELARRPYDIGTELARSIKQLLEKHFSTLSDVELRRKMAELVVQTLPLLRDQIANLKPDQYLSVADVVSLMAKQIPNFSAEDCQRTKLLMPDGDQAQTLQCGVVP